jgi:hypothetical protein
MPIDGRSWRGAEEDDVRRVLLAQGGYYVATGVAPFVSRRAFEALTGPKAEWWLVETVGSLVTTVGAVLSGAALRRRTPPEILAVAIGSAAALASIDIAYVARGRIAPTYLIDAGAELGILAALAVAQRRHERRAGTVVGRPRRTRPPGRRPAMT